MKTKQASEIKIKTPSDLENFIIKTTDDLADGKKSRGETIIALGEMSVEIYNQAKAENQKLINEMAEFMRISLSHMKIWDTDKNKNPELRNGIEQLLKRVKQEMTLHKTVGNIEWYKISEEKYEGFNKKKESWEYTLNKDISGLWVLRGQGKDRVGRNENELMKLK